MSKTLPELERSIKRDAAAYDRAVAAYNALVKRERAAGNIKQSGKSVVISKTTAGKNAGKRLVTAYNAIAKIGQKLKAEILDYNKRISKGKNKRGRKY